MYETCKGIGATGVSLSRAASRGEIEGSEALVICACKRTPRRSLSLSLSLASRVSRYRLIIGIDGALAAAPLPPRLFTLGRTNSGASVRECSRLPKPPVSHARHSRERGARPAPFRPSPFGSADEGRKKKRRARETKGEFHIRAA